MEPCHGPSLTGPPVSQATCGCATGAVPAHQNAYESAWATAAVPAIWLAMLLIFLAFRRRRQAFALGLGPAPEALPAYGMRLVLSEGEKRFFRAVGRPFRAFSRRPVRPTATRLEPVRPVRPIATASRACETT
jgi:hypothetical protein